MKKKGYLLEIIVYKTSQIDEDAIDHDLILETALASDQFLTGEQAIERLRLVHDALEEYKDPASNINNNDVLEDMRQGVDWLIIEACKVIDCTEET